MTIEQQNAKIVELTQLKYLGKIQDKREYLKNNNWELRGDRWDYDGEGHCTGYQTENEALDCEICFLLTGYPYI